MKIKQTKDEIIRGKFINTISKFEAVYNEAQIAINDKQSYSAGAVLSRVESISKAFYSELNKLAKDIED